MAHLPWRLRREIVLPVVLAATITLCSGFPAAVPDVDWLAVDKLGHFALYGALATSVARIPGMTRWPAFGAWWALLLASAYGLGDELRQSLTAGIRSCDWHDWLADTLGAILAVSLYLHWPRYRRLMDAPVWKKQPKLRVENPPETPPTLVP
jgi:VanZ family protein